MEDFRITKQQAKVINAVIGSGGGDARLTAIDGRIIVQSSIVTVEMAHSGVVGGEPVAFELSTKVRDGDVFTVGGDLLDRGLVGVFRDSDKKAQMFRQQAIKDGKSPNRVFSAGTTVLLTITAVDVEPTDLETIKPVGYFRPEIARRVASAYNHDWASTSLGFHFDLHLDGERLWATRGDLLFVHDVRLDEKVSVAVGAQVMMDVADLAGGQALVAGNNGVIYSELGDIVVTATPKPSRIRISDISSVIELKNNLERHVLSIDTPEQARDLSKKLRAALRQIPIKDRKYARAVLDPTAKRIVVGYKDRDIEVGVTGWSDGPEIAVVATSLMEIINDKPVRFYQTKPDGVVVAISDVDAYIMPIKLLAN
ncbi:hypothetical protein [Ferrimicrobium acidiphilum]|jgi:hypothetical protein|uniref:hypothetical protein n=1 Tax=Ferrimicrobium acidiphilum TaxID=121039 RepID=UPI0023F22A01|nr:hypothetical protein [Ferrimicrobium acidiphilum]